MHCQFTYCECFVSLVFSACFPMGVYCFNSSIVTPRYTRFKGGSKVVGCTSEFKVQKASIVGSVETLGIREFFTRYIGQKGKHLDKSSLC